MRNHEYVSDDDWDDIHPLSEANRYSRQANEAEQKGHYRQALDKYARSIEKYRELLKTQENCKTQEALTLLIDAHERRASRIKDYLNSSQTLFIERASNTFL
uniref:MIT domain-containing protein n=1 Tax=Spongospora subterranea TaxID=70186 RepID=A0A0H5R8A5_9EUKA|eukprot:CRZ09937.1 hypothetical protein [Spongospora subterranea]